MEPLGYSNELALSGAKRGTGLMTAELATACGNLGYYQKRTVESYRLTGINMLLKAAALVLVFLALLLQ